MAKKKDKKPVLTSPWKIGTLVAMLLSVTSFGVGYYLVKIYEVDLAWLSSEIPRWGVDSYNFFKEIYPLAAGVLLLSLMSYFVFASAVRRYKFYLDSGQDYRKMISLAESIDDLTNPAQIARLSDFPELQGVLRNYGDQIREISEQLGTKQTEADARSVDLEMEIESLLGGEKTQECIIDGKWWAPIFRKVEDFVVDARGRMKIMEERDEAVKRIIGRASLSYGKMIELVNGASEDLVSIIESAHDLDRLAASDAGGGVQQSGSHGAGVEMELQLQNLQEGGRVLQALSEENNGLALNMALMAARGKVSENDLAQFAEKLRSTAERFKRLGDTVMSIAGSLAGSCTAIGGGTKQTADPQVRRRLLSVSREIDARNKQLQEKLCSLGGELGDMHRMLREGLESFTEGEERQEEPAADTRYRSAKVGDLVNFGASGLVDTDETEDPGFVIDHGRSVWADSSEMVSGDRKSAEGSEEGEAGGSMEHVSLKDGDGTSDTGEDELRERAPQPEDISFADDPSAHRETDRVNPRQAPAGPTEMAGESAPAGGGTGGSWMEMPGHRWVKIDLEKDDKRPMEDVEIEVLRGEQISGEFEVKSPDRAAAQDPEAEEDPVYDLYELGAVEYVEEAKV